MTTFTFSDLLTACAELSAEQVATVAELIKSLIDTEAE